MHRKLRLFGTITLLAGVLASWAGAHNAIAAPAQQTGAQTFTVTIGHEVFTEPGDKSSWQAIKFYPESLTINAGDSVTFKHDSGVEPHTATFLAAGEKYPDLVLPPAQGQSGPPKLEANPLVLFPQGGASYDGSAMASSGAMAADLPGPKAYTLSFSKPGTYTLLCLIHTAALPDGTIVGMQGKVIVQEAGQPYPMTPDQVTAQAKSDMQADEAAAKAAEPAAKKQAVSTQPGPNGTMIYHVNVGYEAPTGTNGALDYMRFSPNDVTIKEGDTVEWSVPSDHGFHNVLLGDEPDIFSFEPQPAGPPKAFINTEIFGPAGATTHTGTGIYSSGIIQGPADNPAPPFTAKYSLTFAKAGRYEYLCGLHYHNGMSAHVTVLSSTGSLPGMPTTGSGNNWLPMSLVAGLILALAGLALRSRKVGTIV